MLVGRVFDETASSSHTTAQTGSLRDRGSRCLSEAGKAWRSEIPDAGVSVSMIPTGTWLTSTLSDSHQTACHKMGTEWEKRREGETVES